MTSRSARRVERSAPVHRFQGSARIVLALSLTRTRSPIAGRLQLEQLGVAAALREQLLVRAHGLHLAVGEDEDPVGHADAGEAVRDEHRGAPLAQLLEALEHLELA